MHVECVFSINQETVHLHKQQQFYETLFKTRPGTISFRKDWQVIHQEI